MILHYKKKERKIVQKIFHKQINNNKNQIKHTYLLERQNGLMSLRNQSTGQCFVQNCVLYILCVLATILSATVLLKDVF